LCESLVELVRYWLTAVFSRYELVAVECRPGRTTATDTKEPFPSTVTGVTDPFIFNPGWVAGDGTKLPVGVTTDPAGHNTERSFSFHL